MSLDKSIQHGKEKRKPYKGSKRFDPSCRNNHGCGWCKGNRTHANKRREPLLEETIPFTIRESQGLLEYYYYSILSRPMVKYTYGYLNPLK